MHPCPASLLFSQFEGPISRRPFRSLPVSGSVDDECTADVRAVRKTSGSSEGGGTGRGLPCGERRAHGGGVDRRRRRRAGNRYFLQSLSHARRLRWMQSNSMGVDLILRARATLEDVILTCARGVYDDEIAEHALALMLALTRGVHHARDDQREQRWVRRPLRTLAGTRALVVGWGGIGRGIARRLAALGVRVEGVRRRGHGEPRDDETGFVVWGPITWRRALPMTDSLTPISRIKCSVK